MTEPLAKTAWQDDEGLRVEPDIDYHARWRAFALRRGLALFLLFTWLPLAVALFLLSRRGLHMPLTALTIIFTWLAAALGAVWWAGEFRCPRCRRRYAAMGAKRGTINITRGLFDRVCANCRLRKFERAR